MGTVHVFFQLEGEGGGVVDMQMLTNASKGGTVTLRVGYICVLFSLRRPNMSIPDIMTRLLTGGGGSPLGKGSYNQGCQKYWYNDLYWLPMFCPIRGYI